MDLLTLFTLTHVAISLAGIGTGFVVLYGFLTARRFNTWTAAFLGTTVATSVTGFFFPADHFTPAHAVGLLSLLVLGFALYARYGRSLFGRWSSIFVVSSVVAQYLNCFVLVVQLFDKVPALKALVPTQSELPFAATQLFVLASFVSMGVASVLRFRGNATEGVGA